MWGVGAGKGKGRFFSGPAEKLESPMEYKRRMKAMEPQPEKGNGKGNGKANGKG
jgi:hypothetical protein